ncbi:MAG: hypothetical protein IJJ04_02370 [Clostridia bacterium]|nr:hypothetical protein [Clostridia bacterium]
MKRVYCLYRVSTKGQVDKDDIPMQRIKCNEFAKAQLRAIKLTIGANTLNSSCNATLNFQEGEI